jgi:hypothetical protein
MCRLRLSPPSLWQVLLAVVTTSARYGGQDARVKIADLVEMTSLAERTVKGALRKLFSMGLLIRVGRYENIRVNFTLTETPSERFITLTPPANAPAESGSVNTPSPTVAAPAELGSANTPSPPAAPAESGIVNTSSSPAAVPAESGIANTLAPPVVAPAKSGSANTLAPPRCTQACTSPTSINVSLDSNDGNVIFTTKQSKLINDVFSESSNLLGSHVADLPLLDGHAAKLGLRLGTTYRQAFVAIKSRVQARDFVAAVLALRKDPRVQGEDLM